jgi:hypothetical protein
VVAVFGATRERLRAELGTPLFIETDPSRTFGGDEDCWAWELPSGQRILVVLKVSRGFALLHCDPPDADLATEALGINPDELEAINRQPDLADRYFGPEGGGSRPTAVFGDVEDVLRTLIESDDPGYGVGSTMLGCWGAANVYQKLGDDAFEWLLRQADDPARRDKRENYLYLLERIGYESDGFSASFVERAYQIVSDKSAPMDVRECCAIGAFTHDGPILYRPEWVHQRLADLARHILADPTLRPAHPNVRIDADHYLRVSARRARVWQDLRQGRVAVADELMERMSSAETELGRQLSTFGLRTDDREFLRYLVGMIEAFGFPSTHTPDGSEMTSLTIRSPGQLSEATAYIRCEPLAGDRTELQDPAREAPVPTAGVRGLARRLFGKRQPEPPPRGPVVITAFHLEHIQ